MILDETDFDILRLSEAGETCIHEVCKNGNMKTLESLLIKIRQILPAKEDL